MTIYDISRMTGVSASTVSRVLNGKKGVGARTREKILACMREQNFTPNALAQGLGTSSSHTVGVMCRDVGDIFLAEAVSAIERELRRRSYDSLLCCTGSDVNMQQGYIDMLLSKQVDAIILVGSHYMNSKNRSSISAAAESVPVVLVNSYFRADNVYCVLSDDGPAAKEAVDKLLASGRRRPVFLRDCDSYSGRQKADGLCAALTEAGLPFSENMLVDCPEDFDGVVGFLQSYFETGKERPDCLLAMDDELAAAALKAAARCGIRVPEELAVVGFNNCVLARACEPELTSVDNHAEALCMTAVSTLFGVLEGKAFPKKTTVSCDLVERGTTNF